MRIAHGATQVAARLERTSDVAFVALPVLQAAALLAYPSIPLIAVGLWWTANTTAHNFIHRPFFSSGALNASFSLLFTAIMGVPQTLWRQRHLAHHADRVWRCHVTPQLIVEFGLLATIWSMLALYAPGFLVAVYLPGWLCGLALCAVQGRYEHLHGATSHYGRIYNILCFNDGYHAEHHAFPGVHWTQLPERPSPQGGTSRWPPLLRWLELFNLNALERVVMRSAALQRIVLNRHRRAFAALLPHLPPVRRIAIVGGGLFPRTALILRDLLPAAQIVVVDRNRANLDAARPWLGPDVEFECRVYPGSDELAAAAYDLVVIPLAFDGNRNDVYAHPPTHTLVHDWLWHRRATSCVVSLALLKRLNLVSRRT